MQALLCAADIRPSELVQLADALIPAELAGWRDELPIFVRPGKMIRARIVAATAGVGGAVREECVQIGALGVELLHEGSLIHDDVCDCSPARRGLPSVPQRRGPRAAAWLGAAVLGWGLDLLAHVAGRCGIRLDLAFAVDAVEAQVLEVLPWDAEPEQQRRRYQEIVQGKTGALFRMACELGGQLGGLCGAEREATRTFAEAFSLGFQVLDDVRDVEGGPQLGKPAGGDLDRHLLTWPVLEWISHARELPSVPRDDANNLRAELARTGMLDRARSFAATQFDIALRALAALPPSPGRDQLTLLVQEHRSTCALS